MEQFCKFSFSADTRKVIWEITNECNYSCSYCIFSSTGFKSNAELTYSQCLTTVDQIQDSGFNYIKFTGGEPFLRKDLIDIFQYIDTNYPALRYDVSTNASLITTEISKKISLLKIDKVHVSLDGSNEIEHESVRGYKTYFKTIQGLQQLLEFNKNVRIGVLVHANNDQKLEEIIKYFIGNAYFKYMPAEIVFSMMQPAGRLSSDSKLVSNRPVSELSIEINRLSEIYGKTIKISENLPSNSTLNINKLTKCPSGKNFLYIDNIGQVTGCTWLKDKKPHVQTHNLRKASIPLILQDQFFVENNCATKNATCLAFGNGHKFNKIYPNTTENLVYIENVKSLVKNPAEKSAFTICGSGDHCIELLRSGFKQVTVMDINPMAIYYCQLKIAAISVLSYKDFKEFFDTNNSACFNYGLFKEIKGHFKSDEIYALKFWTDLYKANKYSGQKIRNDKSLFNQLLSNDFKIISELAPYLRSQQTYDTLKANMLEGYHVKYIICNLFSIKQEFLMSTIWHDRYDLIMLSNLLDYGHLQNKPEIEIISDIFCKLGQISKKDALVVCYFYDGSYHRNDINKPDTQDLFINIHKDVWIKLTIDEFNPRSALIQENQISKSKKDILWLIRKK